MINVWSNQILKIKLNAISTNTTTIYKTVITSFYLHDKCDCLNIYIVISL